jgi:hypothetical protein
MNIALLVEYLTTLTASLMKYNGVQSVNGISYHASHPAKHWWSKQAGSKHIEQSSAFYFSSMHNRYGN